ncbi:hypothetical protein [Thermovibrio sp.]
MKEVDFVEEAVNRLSSLPFVEKVEVVPVCEIYIDACLKVFVRELSQEVKRQVAEVVISVADRFTERLGRRPEIYYDVVKGE